jgi:hypothetical protein
LSSSNTSNNIERGYPSQIPKGEDVPAQVQKVVSEEAGVEGSKKGSKCRSYSKVTSLGQVLKDLDFPVNKDKIIQFVQQKKSDSQLLSQLEKIEDRQYQNVSDVTKAADMVYGC